MDLEKLKNIRSKKEKINFPISERELCERYENVFSGAINDALREKGLFNQELPNNISALKDDMKVAGIAFTVKGCKSFEVKDEMNKRVKMLDDIHESSVCIWDTSEDDVSAQWGEVMTIASKERGCRGAVVDGGVRDTDRVLKLDFPVFNKYKTSNGMLGRFSIIDHQVPIQIGGIEIFPGDIVFGDLDGVLIIPRKHAYEVLTEAEKTKNEEKNIKRWVKEGMSASDVVDKGGYF